MKRRYCAGILLAAVLLCLGLGGCLEHPLRHSRREAIRYLEERYPGEEIQVDFWSRTEQDPEYELRRSRVWDCRFADTPEIPFQVRSVWWTGNPAPVAGYRLTDNARWVFRQAYMERYLAQEGALDAWEVEGSSLSLKFSSMEQVYPAAEQLQALYDWYTGRPHSGEVPLASCELTDLPLPVWHLDDSVSVRAEYDNWDSTRQYVESACASRLKYCYGFYRLPCPDFTPEQMEKYARWVWPWNDRYPFPESVWYRGEQAPKDTFAGIGVEGSFVSWAGFYEILSRLDYPLEGTADHFTFTGQDGCRYEFSYAFCREEDSETQWYFTRDGEARTSGSSYTGGAPLLYLKDEALEEMAGLKFFYRGG